MRGVNHMQLTYISRFQFKIVNGKVYALPAYGDAFWQKYLDIFDTILVIGEYVKPYLDNGTMIEIIDYRINVELVESIESPSEYLRTWKVHAKLNSIISHADIALIKPASRKGMYSIKQCKKYNIPYMIEMTGDIRCSLANRKEAIYKIYANYIYRLICKTIKDCRYGLYVTEEYLQRQYPIDGLMCGCTDAVISRVPDSVLTKRQLKIKNLFAISQHKDINIGLIGYYHDNNKGIDTAIKALSLLKVEGVSLKVLGVGVEADRNMWISLANEVGVQNAIAFPKPRIGSLEVGEWIDSIDICILPSRSEGFPRAIAEAMSRGCPCITSDVAGLKEMVEEKWQHSAADYSRLAHLIEDMLTHEELMHEAASFNFLRGKNYEVEVLRSRRNAFLRDFRSSAEKKHA